MKDIAIDALVQLTDSTNADITAFLLILGLKNDFLTLLMKSFEVSIDARDKQNAKLMTIISNFVECKDQFASKYVEQLLEAGLLNQIHRIFMDNCFTDLFDLALLTCSNIAGDSKQHAVQISNIQINSFNTGIITKRVHSMKFKLNWRQKNYA